MAAFERHVPHQRQKSGFAHGRRRDRVSYPLVVAAMAFACAHGRSALLDDERERVDQAFLGAVVTAAGRVESIAGVRLGEPPESIESRFSGTRRSSAPDGQTRYLAWALGEKLPFIEVKFAGGRAVSVMVAFLAPATHRSASEGRLSFCRKYFQLANEFSTRWGAGTNTRTGVCEGEESSLSSDDVSTTEWRLGEARISLAIARSNFGEPGLFLEVENEVPAADYAPAR